MYLHTPNARESRERLASCQSESLRTRDIYAQLLPNRNLKCPHPDRMTRILVLLQYTHIHENNIQPKHTTEVFSRKISHHVGVHDLPSAGHDLESFVCARRGDNRISARHCRDYVLHHTERQLVRHAIDTVRVGSVFRLVTHPLQSNRERPRKK